MVPTGVGKPEFGDEKGPSNSEKIKHYMPKKRNGQHDSQGWSNGKVMNLMSTGTAHMGQVTMWSHMPWTMPLQLRIVIASLIINIGVSALAGSRNLNIPQRRH